MIYNRYNPCQVVYVLYNCTRSFEGLSYPIHILIITRLYLCRLLEHQARHSQPAASRASTASTLEPMVLPGGGPMEAMGVQKLYEPSPTPILYVGLAADLLGRVPLMLLFLLGNSTPTIPHQLRQHRGAMSYAWHMT